MARIAEVRVIELENGQWEVEFQWDSGNVTTERCGGWQAAINHAIRGARRLEWQYINMKIQPPNKKK